MKVRSLKNNTIHEATKKDDNTYIVEGKEIAKEDMNKYFTIVKEQTESKKEVNMTIVDSSTDMGGDIGALAGALAKCQGEFTAVKKGTAAYNYNYADINAVLQTSSPITSKYEISITQMNVSKLVGEHLLIGVKTVLMHSGGGYMSSEIYVPAVKSKSNTLVQMAGVNITYLRRYGIQSALGLATTDSDGTE